MTFPILSGRAAPKYWATKVLEKPMVPRKKAIRVYCKIPAGMEAARASGEYRDRKTRSTKWRTAQSPELIIRGSETARTSRRLPG
jgi:hypothetical protein